MNRDGDRNTVAISVDGPSASGKSTVSRGVARRLGFIYCDSGSLYRAVTWKALHEGVNLEKESAVTSMLDETEWEFECVDNAMVFRIDGIDPGREIRSANVADNVSTIARMGGVRSFIVDKLRHMADCGSLVMEGRDIGSVVFPNARFKYYLDASAEERARRRHAEFAVQNECDDIEEVYESLKRRDRTDSSRKTAPLRVPRDAMVIDSTALAQQEVVDIIVEDVAESMRER